MYLKRDIDNYFLKWKNNTKHKALKVFGARQVGKTTSIKNFAESNYKNVIYINLEEPVGDDFIEYIENNKHLQTKDLLIYYMQSHHFKYTDDTDTVIIIDEIQLSETVWKLIRPINIYLKCDLIVTGSNLTITNKMFQPAGNCVSIKMHTMSFHEFLNCIGLTNYYDIACKALAQSTYEMQSASEALAKSIPELTEKQQNLLHKAFLAYCNVGGYPSAVKSFMQGLDYKEELKDIIDVAKLELNNVIDPIITRERIEYLCDSIVISMLNEKKGDKNLIEHLTKSVNNKTSRFKSSKDDIYVLLNWMLEADLISICEGLDLNNDRVMKAQRIYFNDLGLLNYLLNRVCTDSGNVFGLLAKNFVFKAFYNKDTDLAKIYFGTCNNYEYDFVLESSNKSIRKLIEVKHGNGTSKSMEYMINTHPEYKYDFYSGNRVDIKLDKNINHYPIYLVDETILNGIENSKKEDPVSELTFLDFQL